MGSLHSLALALAAPACSPIVSDYGVSPLVIKKNQTVSQELAFHISVKCICPVARTCQPNYVDPKYDFLELIDFFVINLSNFDPLKKKLQ